MEGSRAKLAAGLAGAGAALAVAVVLLHFQVSPVATWFYVFAWYPTLVIFDLLIMWHGGPSLFARPRVLLPMLWWSAVIWFLFEAINFRLQDWYYVFLPAGRVERWLGITVSLATVVPAILLPERLLERLGAWRTLSAPPLGERRGELAAALALGVITLGATLALPRYLHPLTWGAIWLIAEPLLYRTDPALSLFGDMRRGEWGRVARLLVAGLAAGVLWEAFNAHARGKWIYTVPFLEHLKVFEMPVVGFLGFPFFALEVWSLYHLLAARTRWAPVLASALLAVLVLVGMDRWTVSSTVPRLADLPRVSGRTVARLEAAGLDDVFRIAESAPDELVNRARLTPDEARAVHTAAELTTLRGIGTRHAAALMQGGITTVAALAAAAPESVFRVTHRGPRPTLPEVRMWIRAARNAASGRPASAAAASGLQSPGPRIAGPSAPERDPRTPSRP